MQYYLINQVINIVFPVAISSNYWLGTRRQLVVSYGGSDLEMKYLVLLLLVHYSYAYRTTVVQPENKRQVPGDFDVACYQAYVSLTADEKKCFDTGDDDSDDYGSSEDILTPSDLSDICGSGFCKDVAKKLLKACKVWLQLTIWVRRNRVVTTFVFIIRRCYRILLIIM